MQLNFVFFILQFVSIYWREVYCKQKSSRSLFPKQLSKRSLKQKSKRRGIHPPPLDDSTGGAASPSALKPRHGKQEEIEAEQEQEEPQNQRRPGPSPRLRPRLGAARAATSRTLGGRCWRWRLPAGPGCAQRRRRAVWAPLPLKSQRRVPLPFRARRARPPQRGKRISPLRPLVRLPARCLGKCSWGLFRRHCAVLRRIRARLPHRVRTLYILNLHTYYTCQCA